MLLRSKRVARVSFVVALAATALMVPLFQIVGRDGSGPASTGGSTSCEPGWTFAENACFKLPEGAVYLQCDESGGGRKDLKGDWLSLDRWIELNLSHSSCTSFVPRYTGLYERR